MKVLYIGGTGQISFDCIHQTVKAGHEVTVFNRGKHNAGLPESVDFITGDFNDDRQYAQILEHSFDVICQFRVFTPGEMKRDLYCPRQGPGKRNPPGPCSVGYAHQILP